MKTLVFIVLLILAMSEIIPNHRLLSITNLNRRVGSLSENKSLNQANLDAQFSKINDFIRANVQEVKGLALITYRNQVVAGRNYFFTYDSATKPGSKKVDITVYSRPWENDYLKLVRPNGTTVQRGGVNPNKIRNSK